MSNYQSNAIATLKAMNVNFVVNSNPSFGFHFQGDTTQRYIFNVKFSRNGKSFSLKFGQSIAAGSNPPSEYGVLACIQKYDVGSFSDFCDCFGYDDDSRKALKIYKAVCAEYKKVSGFFTPDELEILAEIQ